MARMGDHEASSLKDWAMWYKLSDSGVDGYWAKFFD
jgi:hypothetical protein